jgi:hypothetical protein
VDVNGNTEDDDEEDEEENEEDAVKLAFKPTKTATCSIFKRFLNDVLCASLSEMILSSLTKTHSSFLPISFFSIRKFFKSINVFDLLHLHTNGGESPRVFK